MSRTVFAQLGYVVPCVETGQSGAEHETIDAEHAYNVMDVR